MAKDDDVSIFDELEDKLNDFFAEDDDLFLEDDDMFSTGDDESPGENVDSDAREDEAIDQEENDLPVEVNSEEIVKEPVVTEEVQSSENAYKQTKLNSENPLEHLKIIVLEMDWEISDKNLNKYLAEINRLIVIYKNDRPIYLFFKLHATLGNYMLLKKARAHPDALRFLYRVYDSLENALKVGVPLVEKNRLILDEVNNFKSLKKKLFPDFYSDESDEVKTTESGGTPEDSVDVAKSESDNFDISQLPDDVQDGINAHIEKMIEKKIESMNKSN